MSTEPRTITLATLDAGAVALAEPSWCRGHADHRPDAYRADLTHYGPEHRLTHNGAELFRLLLAQSPLAERASRDIEAYVEQSGYTGSLDAAGLYDLAAALDSAADQMRTFADQMPAAEEGDA